MAEQPDDNNVLISAARVVGSAIGRVKRLTSAVSAPATKEDSTRQRAGNASRKTRKTAASGRTQESQGTPQMGASRSPRQTEAKGRGKSRSKSSKTRKRSVRKRSR